MDDITITREVYEILLHDSKILQALFAAGVDDWEGYELAMEDIE
jgi:hypothetical protein